ncbi:cupin [Natrinema pellirubrum DSM 15624]|uniref:Cupin n=1 Tax=Natrinema pellirubrum (strain DSM 15624 / CIP 106293 / JCM 10476 / NCIMB 786 / 157) TaxID=797303 RepID=L0JNX8_NATP1|nr:cupin domain-containing protein [Natrinema pellirubrum]AGB32061.1 cupin domain-containing protein [Natrinema pellirubrum DSM 15624]ELY78073.1 cupin [Natrinema pellirubrum DSM 15624]ELZ07106.1 cupin [Natrinema thermotolerans DSM 11552]
MGYDTVAKTDPDSVIDEEWGGMWFLKEPLATEELGISILELEPGGKGMEHAEAESGQEEVYYVVEGRVDVDLTDAGETVTLETDEAIRLDPEESRQILNQYDERAKLVLVGAPL